jgi:hypothetical protein
VTAQGTGASRGRSKKPFARFSFPSFRASHSAFAFKKDKDPPIFQSSNSTHSAVQSSSGLNACYWHFSYIRSAPRAEAYSAATGSSSGRSGSSLLSDFSEGAAGADKLSRRKSTIKSCKHSTGTEYVLSAVEYLVRNEITILSSADE